jgi:hypothetical protein
MYGQKSATEKQACARTSALDMELVRSTAIASASKDLTVKLNGLVPTALLALVPLILPGLVLLLTRTTYILGLSAPTRVSAIAQVVNASASLDTKVLPASVPFVPTTAMTKELAGLRSFLLARQVVSTMLHGMQ